MSVAGLRAVLRIARRDATRAKGRSALVLAMIGLPVLAITAFVVLLRTDDTTAVEELPWNLGTAEAKVTAYGRAAVLQDPYTRRVMPSAERSGDSARPWRAEEVASAFGRGTRLVSVAEGRAAFRTEHGYGRAGVREVDVRDPLTDGMLRLVDGRAPRSEHEVLVSPAIAERGSGIGGTLHVTREDTPKRVVGVAADPRAPDRALVVAPPGSGILGADPRRSWLVDTPEPVSWEAVRELNAGGLAVLSRAVVHDPPPRREIPEEVRTAQGISDTMVLVVALIVTMIVLEVVLLAGPAFAVGLRRQRRQLALVATGGGAPRQLRAIVLAGGLVLGVTAAALGALAGVGVAAAATPLLSRSTSMGPFEVPWGQVGTVAALGAGSGVLAALVPAAQAARMDVVAALAGRRGETRTRRGWPLVGLVVTAVGVAVTVLAVRVGELGIVAGAILTQLGLVVASPWIVGLAGRLAGRFPLPLRLAARDAARNRGRTAPAVAAVTAAVAGVTALAIAGNSDIAERRAEYVPRAPVGTTTVSIPTYEPSVQDRLPVVQEELRRVLARELPGVPVLELREPAIDTWGMTCDGFSACRTLRAETRCDPGEVCGLSATPTFGTPLGYVVGGESVLRFLLGGDDPAAVRALAEGKAVVFNPAAVREGNLTLQITRRPPDYADPAVERRVDVPAVVREEPAVAAKALLPPEAAEQLGVDLATRTYVVDPDDHRLTPDEEQRLSEAVAGVTPLASVYVERGYDDSLGFVYALLVVTAVVMVLGGTLVATGLAAADSRPDLATLAAVGAAPRTRRLITMGQAAVVAVLGVGLGLVAGAVPGVAMTWPLTMTDGLPGQPQVAGPMIDVPWLLLGGLAATLPLLAVLAAGIFTRSRLPTVRGVER